MKDGAKSVERDDRDLLRVIQFSSAFSLGLMAALLFSEKQVTPDLRCELSAGSGIAFLVGATFSWLFWRVVFKVDGKRTGPGKRRVLFAALSVLLSLATVAAFAFALKGVGNEKLREIIQGTLLAVFALSGVGFLLWRIARFLESDNKRVTEDTPPDSKK